MQYLRLQSSPAPCLARSASRKTLLVFADDRDAPLNWFPDLSGTAFEHGIVPYQDPLAGHFWSPIQLLVIFVFSVVTRILLLVPGNYRLRYLTGLTAASQDVDQDLSHGGIGIVNSEAFRLDVDLQARKPRATVMSGPHDCHCWGRKAVTVHATLHSAVTYQFTTPFTVISERPLPSS